MPHITIENINTINNQAVIAQMLSAAQKNDSLCKDSPFVRLKNITPNSTDHIFSDDLILVKRPSQYYPNEFRYTLYSEES